MLREVVVYAAVLGPIAAARLLQVGQSGLDRNPIRFLFFAGGACGPGQAERANQWREAQSLNDQRRDDDAECEKYDEVSLRKGHSVRQRRRQGHGRGE